MIYVYADIIFLVNLVMDFFVLFITGKAVKKHVATPLLAAGSFVMALAYCLVIFLAPLNKYYSFFAGAIILMIGIIISYRPFDVKDFLRLVAVAYAVSFTLGGIGMSLFYFTDISNVLKVVTGYTMENFSVKMLFWSTLAFYLLFKLVLHWMNRLAVKKQTFCGVNIFCGQKRVLINALLDTGNSLRDPLSDSPVIIAEFDSVKEFLPDDIKLVYYERNEAELPNSLLSVTDNGFKGRVRFIPFTSLGLQNGLLLGFRADKVEIQNDKKHLTLANAIIGIYNFELSKDGSYNGLLGPEALAE